jgi:hypothetical protein
MPVQYHIVVPVPVGQVLKSRPEGQSLRFTTFGRNYKYVRVPIILPGECDHLPVGRELGEQLRARIRGEPSGDPSLNRDQPQILRIHKDDLILVDVRET